MFLLQVDSDVEPATGPNEEIKTLVFLEDTSTLTQASDTEELSFICQRNRTGTGSDHNLECNEH